VVRDAVRLAAFELGRPCSNLRGAGRQTLAFLATAERTALFNSCRTWNW